MPKNQSIYFHLPYCVAVRNSGNLIFRYDDCHEQPPQVMRWFYAYGVHGICALRNTHLSRKTSSEASPCVRAAYVHVRNVVFSEFCYLHPYFVSHTICFQPYIVGQHRAYRHYHWYFSICHSQMLCF